MGLNETGRITPPGLVTRNTVSPHVALHVLYELPGLGVGRMERKARMLLTLALAAYGLIMLRDLSVYRFLDHVDLAIHETGHLVFAPLGEFAHFLGGTLFQLLLPFAFVVYFARQGDRHAASIVLWWVAQNFWNVSIYVRDARSQLLPLVGGGGHDWTYILGRLQILHLDQDIALAVQFTGVVA